MKPEHRQLLDDILASAENLRQTVEAVPDHLLDQRPGPDDWSVTETLVHIRNVVMLVYGLRIRLLLFQENATFANYEEDGHLLSASRKQLTPAEILDMIEIDHRQTVSLLKILPEGDWARQGRHPRFGAMSIEFLARRFVEHAVEHTQQIADTVRTLT